MEFDFSQNSSEIDDVVLILREKSETQRHLMAFLAIGRVGI